MNKVKKTSEPIEGLMFIDVHCHLPFPRPRKNDKLPSDETQFREYFEKGGLFLISSTVDNTTLRLCLDFKKTHTQKYGFTNGWAPQTVTYTPGHQYKAEWKKWIEYTLNHPKDYIAIGEIGLDFHHAKDLAGRTRQVKELEKVFEQTKELEKPYVLHIRNAAPHERDKANPNHPFNDPDGANREILRVLDDFRIDPNKVMWHCFSGPEQYGKLLSEKGYYLSVPSSAYSSTRWQKATKTASITSLVTETDSYYQHPYLRGPVNVPSNVRYSIASIAYTHQLSQEIVSRETIKNAIEFFELPIDYGS